MAIATGTPWQYLSAKVARDCKGCGKSTRGRLVKGDQQIPSCPRCRDTKSIFQIMTGESRNDVNVFSDNSRAQSENIPAEQQLPPMLCRAFKDVKPRHLQKNILEDLNWITCYKYDGVRVLGYITADTIFYLSRNKSKGNALYADKSGPMPHLRPRIPELDGTVFDAEVLFSGEVLDTGAIVTSHPLNATVALVNSDAEKSIALQEKYGKLKVIIFDVLKFRGNDIRHQPLKARQMFRSKVLELLRLRVPEWFEVEQFYQGSRKGKEEFYQTIIQDGGEGVVYKDLNSSYSLSASARPISWVKRKVRHTVDAVITGYKPGEGGFTGLVGALYASVYIEDGSLKEIARVSSIKLEVRKEMTDTDGSLKPEYYNQVIEISLQEVTTKSERGRHATLDRFRPDKDPESCTFESMTMS